MVVIEMMEILFRKMPGDKRQQAQAASGETHPGIRRNSSS